MDLEIRLGRCFLKIHNDVELQIRILLENVDVEKILIWKVVVGNFFKDILDYYHGVIRFDLKEKYKEHKEVDAMKRMGRKTRIAGWTQIFQADRFLSFLFFVCLSQWEMVILYTFLQIAGCG